MKATKYICFLLHLLKEHFSKIEKTAISLSSPCPPYLDNVYCLSNYDDNNVRHNKRRYHSGITLLSTLCAPPPPHPPPPSPRLLIVAKDKAELGHDILYIHYTGLCIVLYRYFWPVSAPPPRANRGPTTCDSASLLRHIGWVWNIMLCAFPRVLVVFYLTERIYFQLILSASELSWFKQALFIF